MGTPTDKPNEDDTQGIDSRTGDGDETLAFSDAAASSPLINAPGSASLSGTFGRYVIKKALGDGAMGTVYLAHDAQLERDVALKVPKFPPNAPPEQLERFYQEAKAAAKLSHPNLCPVYDVGEFEGVHYIAMAFIEGRTLLDYVETGRHQPQTQISTVLRKIALGMDEAHSHGIVHRDLKPANVMINQRNEPIVTDFGLARQIDNDQARLTQDGMMLGSPAYMPPEQFSDASYQPGPQADVYALGVMMFELLTGELPFQGTGSIASIIAQVLSQPTPDISELRTDVDPRLVDICQQAMAKEPDERYSSMKAFAADLTRFLRDSVGSGQREVKPVTKTAGAEVTRAEEKCRMVRSLAKTQQFAAAATILEELSHEDHPEAKKYVDWAQEQLPLMKAAAQKVEGSEQASTPATQSGVASLLDDFDDEPEIAGGTHLAALPKAKSPAISPTVLFAIGGAILAVFILGFIGWAILGSLGTPTTTTYSEVYAAINDDTIVSPSDTSGSTEPTRSPAPVDAVVPSPPAGNDPSVKVVPPIKTPEKIGLTPQEKPHLPTIKPVEQSPKDPLPTLPDPKQPIGNNPLDDFVDRPKEPVHRPTHPKSVAQLLERHDRNKNGIIELSELKGIGHRPVLRGADANNDGKITRSELAQFIKKHPLPAGPLKGPPHGPPNRPGPPNFPGPKGRPR